MEPLSNNLIPVIVSGALGRMGSEVVKAVESSKDCRLVAAIDSQLDKVGRDVGELLGMDNLGVEISTDFEGSLCAVSQSVRDIGPKGAAVLVDFTSPKSVYEHTRAAIAYGVHPVIGTTGLTTEQITELSDFSQKASISSAIIPNFSVGMVLLQQAAAAAANFYEHVELTELHHNQKLDAPSGTCIKTAELIEEIGKKFNHSDISEEQSIDGCRGGERTSGIRIHSVRLPGLVAHQEVLFGSLGETYLLKHDTIDRSAYMPGVLLAIRKVRNMNGLIYGLEKLL
tara:strand:- start:743 stop:1594 length:852 start_codon:yes stop_codon:yes gene_type:complete